MLPFLGRGAPPWFAFIVHLRDTEDAERFGFGVFLRRYSADEADYRRKLCSVPPVVAAKISFRNTAATGELICIMRLPEQVAGADGKRFVREAVDLAASRGAAVVGLGGLTAPATGGGLVLCDSLPRGVTLTNGNALTAFAVLQNVTEAARLLGLGTRARVAIIGCTGSVGGAASRLVAAAGFPLTLIGRSAQRVARMFSDVAGEYAGDLNVVAHASIVVLLTNDPAAAPAPEMLRSGTVVIDCAQPPSIARSRYAAFAAVGSTVVEGGLAAIDGYTITGDLAVSEPGSTFACLAETYVLARAGIRAHSVGRPTVAEAERLALLAPRFGVRIVSLEPRLSAFQEQIAS